MGRHIATIGALLTLGLATACSGSADGDADGGGQALLDAGPALDADSEPPSWSALDAWLQQQVSSGAIHGYGVQIFNASDTLVFHSQAGVCGDPGGPCGGAPANTPFTVDLPLGVASSSKWVTSTVVLATLERAVAQGKYADLDQALDVRTDELLTCAKSGAGRGAGVTLRQLLSFVDGLLPEHSCVGAAGETLQTCACKILHDSATAEVASPTAGTPQRNAQPPGTVFKYGGAHHVIAGAMVEALSGQRWPELYATLVQGPAGLSARYLNPTSLAGSLRASISDYARFVRALFHDGTRATSEAPTILSSAAVSQQQRSQMPPGVVYLVTPQRGSEYGLNNWRWCVAPYTSGDLSKGGLSQDPSCAREHQTGHGGKGGYQPWIDLTHGFYGVFAMREPSAGGGADYQDLELNVTAYVRLYAALVFKSERGR